MRRVAFALLPLVSSCALFHPESADWQRAGTTPDQMSVDLGACTRTADAHFKQEQNIQQDMTTDQTDMGQDQLVSNLGSYQQQRDYQKMIDDCMLAAGYSHDLQQGSN
jgi:hypothetical protein